MGEQRGSGFLLKQRAFIKLYVYRMVHENKRYGKQYILDLQNEFRVFGYLPTHTEIYQTLHELTREGLVTREKQIKGQKGVDFQEIILYTLTDSGKKEYELYKKQLKVELERSRDMLDKALRDHYGPVK